MLSPGEKIKINNMIGEIISTYNIGEMSYAKIFFEENKDIKDYCLEHIDYERTFDPSAPLKNLSVKDVKNKQEVLSANLLELRVQAEKMQLAYENSNLLSISNSLVRMEPYQLDCVNQVMNNVRQRALIADDVGLGKTIEAGLIFKELEARRRIDRALFVVPAHLQKKWLKEMERFFDLDLTLADRTWVESQKRKWGENTNIWEQSDEYLIASMAFLRQPEFEEPLSKAFWDIVIVDECHKAAKRGSTPSETSKRVENISHNTDSLLLLSATPHDGKEQSFRSLISYVDPYLVAPEKELHKDDIEPIMIRRSKEMIYDDEGERVFPDREVKTIQVDMTQEERTFYEAVTDYVRNIYNKSELLNEPIVGFMTALMQKRLVSSLGAIKETLQRRLESLRNKEDIKDLSQEAQLYYEGEDLEEIDKEKAEKDFMKVTSTYEDLEEEIMYLEDLVKKAENISIDTKAERIINFIHNLLDENPREKVLIFTEYTDTLNYLLNMFKEEYWREEILVIHGGIDKEERSKIEKEFNYGPSRILFATDAASEGIDLQKSCHIMINIELPWNPNKLEQRIGRLHRYGQEKEVKVWNFHYDNTRESEIFELLREKIENIREKVGNTADVLGMLEDVDISDFVLESIKDRKPPAASKEEFEEILEEREEILKEWYDRSLIDFSTFDSESRERINELIEMSEEIYGGKESLKEFLYACLDRWSGEIVEIEPNLFRLEFEDTEIKNETQNRDINLDEFYTFSREKALEDNCNYISPESNLIKFFIEKVKTMSSIESRIGVKSLPFVNKPGINFIFKLIFEDGSGEILRESAIPVFVDAEIKDCDQRLGERIIEGINLEYHPNLDMIQRVLSEKNRLRNSAEHYVSNKIENIKREIEKEREPKIEDEMDSLKKYERSEKQRLQKFIEKYKEKQEKGEEMEISIRRQKYRLDRLEERIEARRTELEKKLNIIALGPELIGCCIALPG